MRGSFGSVLVSVIGAALLVGCGGAGTDIEASQHGKRLQLVSTTDETTLPTFTKPPTASAIHSAPQAREHYRDVAGVVLVDPTSGAQTLHQWLLLDSGDSFVSRTCPVSDMGGQKGGVDFPRCSAWTEADSIDALGLAGVTALRSLSFFVLPTSYGSQSLVQVAFDDDGSMRFSRSCPIAGGEITWNACAPVVVEELATSFGIPQVSDFSDEVVVAFVDGKGQPAVSQEVLALNGASAWTRTCPTYEASGCAFAGNAEPIADLGIHYDAVEGIGGYTYVDGDETLYAQTVLAEGGTSASRRLCPVTSTGVDFGKCRTWQAVDLAGATSTTGSML